MDEKEPGNGQDWVEDARTELSGMMKQRMDHPSTKPVLTGGAGYMLYRRIKR